ncbi:MAG TPA: 7,8-didemethyl-8-hydroxy-5-deazariboflavin synthase subunit CofG [Pyrinomonadaceae bacterium]|nr:7,8-didemethyl-8-hydroxy-5-deazariboflavin synthase subunit CofG [Pyrinomonadaceae bacterium]
MSLQPQNTLVNYSPSWTLIPTHWCRNTCGYCVFVERTGEGAQLISPDDARNEIKRARAAGATELLVMSGEGVEESRSVGDSLRRFGFNSYVEYVVSIARTALEYDILPHVNIGNVSADELNALRAVVPSMGMMVETTNKGLRNGAAHRRAPDKEPARRLETLCAAGRARVPFTTGLLVGIGETPRAREETLEAIARIHRVYGHIQEVIVQPFTPHPGTAMEDYPPPSFAEVRETIEMARAILPSDITVQIPPNLSPRFVELVQAGARDLGGISPDGDRINPAERWLAPDTYAAALASSGFSLRARLAVHDGWISSDWLSGESLATVERVQPRLPRHPRVLASDLVDNYAERDFMARV